MTDNPKDPEAAEAKSEEALVVQGARENIDTLALLKDFEDSEIVQEFLGAFGLESIAEGFEDEEIFS